MMKISLIFILMFSAPLSFASSAQQIFVEGYAIKTYQRYSEAAQMAKNLDLQIQAFVASPSQERFETAKKTWIEARKVYGVTEVYRFYDGPIEENEGAINGWPLDEVYIDYVIAKPSAGIINDVATYSEINPELLLSLNELDGEKNLSTGWHAMEFLLWGQDTLPNAPGQRKYTDYTTAKNADRRAAYLSAISHLLVEQISAVAEQWSPNDKNNYGASFIASKESFKKVIEAAAFLAGEELAGERLLVAYTSQLQEDEHSCFSDTTTNDVRANFIGIQNVLTDNYQGVSFITMVREQDSVLAQKLQDNLTVIEAQIEQFPPVFDQAISDPEARVLMKSIIDNLMVLGEDIKMGLQTIQ